MYIWGDKGSFPLLFSRDDLELNARPLLRTVTQSVEKLNLWNSCAELSSTVSATAGRANSETSISASSSLFLCPQSSYRTQNYSDSSAWFFSSVLSHISVGSACLFLSSVGSAIRSVCARSFLCPSPPVQIPQGLQFVHEAKPGPRCSFPTKKFTCEWSLSASFARSWRGWTDRSWYGFGCSQLSASSGWEGKLRPLCGREQSRVLPRWLRSRASLCSGIVMCVIMCVYVRTCIWWHLHMQRATGTHLLQLQHC